MRYAACYALVLFEFSRKETSIGIILTPFVSALFRHVEGSSDAASYTQCDEWMVIDKPAGWHSMGPGNSVEEWLAAETGTGKSGQGGIVHRLDSVTSGLDAFLTVIFPVLTVVCLMYCWLAHC